MESKSMEVVTATAQFLWVVRRHKGEVPKYVEIRLISYGRQRKGWEAGQLGYAVGVVLAG